MYSELIPSITERLTLFVKELSFPQTTSTDDAFFNRNWDGIIGFTGPELELSLGRSAGSGCYAPLQKRVAKRIGGGSLVAAPMPKSVPSCRKNRLTALRGECFAYLSPMGWPGIYSICFSQLDGDKDSISLDGGFSVLIAVRLLRDN